MKFKKYLLYKFKLANSKATQCQAPSGKKNLNIAPLKVTAAQTAKKKHINMFAK